MSTFPEPLPNDPENVSDDRREDSPSTDPLAPENTPAPPAEWTGEPEEPSSGPEAVASAEISPFPRTEYPPHQPFLENYAQVPFPPPREERIPHLGHLGLLVLLGLLGWLGAGMLIILALQIHLWGITSLTKAATDFHFTLSSQAAQYVITYIECLVVFPLVWRRSFFDGIHWHGRFAIHRSGRLISAAILCFFVAMINGMLMPGPTNAPIDQLFKTPGAAWFLFGFGITLAPLIEEMAFRGFLLPSLCTAYDWCVEHLTGAPRRPLDHDGNPQWSLAAMVAGSIVTSVPFALMHGAQTGWSLGPFLLLIFVSLVLCWVRLSTRSLAASTLVHACYNFMLFSFMLAGTGGFRHLDKM